MLSKESMRWIPAGSMSCACTEECRVPEDSIWRVTEREVFRRNTESEGQPEHGRNKKTTQKHFWWRCAYGTHPFSSRTRWLRRKRPMVLHWRRCGRVGGCQIKWGRSSAGRAPALQAGGQEFESLRLHLVIFHYNLIPLTWAHSSAG